MNVDSSPHPIAISVEDRSEDNTELQSNENGRKLGIAVHEVEKVTGKRLLSPLEHQIQTATPIKKRRIDENLDSLIEASSLSKLENPKKKTKKKGKTFVINRFTLNKYPHEIRDAAEKMVQTCDNRNIRINHTFFSMLKYYDLDNNNHYEDLKKFYEKCNVFFTHLDTEKYHKTTLLSKMLNKSNHYSINIIKKKFINMSDDHIKNVANSPWLKKISNMYTCTGLPTAEDMNDPTMLVKMAISNKKTQDPDNKVEINKFTLDKYPPDICEAAKKMVQTCDNRNITIKSVFFRMLKYHDITNDHQRKELKQFYEKCNVFFAALDTKQHRNTTCLSNMLNKSNRFNITRISNKFINMSDNDIKIIATSPHLENISAIYNGKGLPTAEEIKDPTIFVKLKKLNEKIKTTKTIEINQFTLHKYPNDIRKAAEKMVETCKNRGIYISESLFSMLKYHDLTNDTHRKDLKQFYKKCNVFFKGLDTDYIRNTYPITSMLNKSNANNVVTISRRFIMMSDTDIHNIANNPYLKNISSMCHGNGFPLAKKMKTFLEISCLKKNWEGNDEDVKEEPIDYEKLNIISSMCRNKGIPTDKDVQDFMGMTYLKNGWQDDDEQAVKGNGIHWEVIKKISSICYGKGLPTTEAVQDFLNTSCMKKNWHGNDHDVKKEPLDQETLSCISLMNHGKGIPEKQAVQTFLNMPCLKEGWHDNCDAQAIEGSPFNWRVLRIISSICNARGLPTEKAVQDLLNSSCLKQGWQDGGDDQAVKGNPINWKLLKSISSICNSNGIPTEAALKDFIKWLPSDEQNLYYRHCCQSNFFFWSTYKKKH